MRAVTQKTYGAPEVLTIAEVSRPALGECQVLVEVHASAVTQGDRRLRAADFPGFSAIFGRLLIGLRGPRKPIPGSMFAGRVVAVGPGVTRFAVGDDIFGSVMNGAYAEFIAVGENETVAHMPEGVSYADAAAVPYGGLTALAFLRDMAKVRPGERVLIVGASGGVGRYAVQIAKHLGAEVTAVCSRDHDLMRELGADRVIDYTKEDFTSGEDRWDVIFDTSEPDFRRRSRALTPTGRYLSLYMTVGLLFRMMLGAIFGGRRAITGVAMGTPQQMENMGELMRQGVVRATIARRFPFESIAGAHAYLEQGRVGGDIVVDVKEQAVMARSRLRVA